MQKFMTIMGYLVRLMPAPETEETLGEFLLDALEEFVQKTDNKIDDILVLPMIKAMRLAHDKKEDKEDK
jgi:hypothetical protein